MFIKEEPPIASGRGRFLRRTFDLYGTVERTSLHVGEDADASARGIVTGFDNLGASRVEAEALARVRELVILPPLESLQRCLGTLLLELPERFRLGNVEAVGFLKSLVPGLHPTNVHGYVPAIVGVFVGR